MNERDLQDAMAAAGKSLADGLAEHEEARRKADAERAIAESRSNALRRTKLSLGRERERNRDAVLRAVADYCSEARTAALDRLKNDKRMPRSINHVERYNALLGMDDRSEVLRRLDQTIGKAEAILSEAGEIDAGAALREAAEWYGERTARLNGIAVSAAEEQVEDETAELPSAPAPKRDDSDEAFDRAIDDAFGSAFDALSEEEAQQEEAVAEDNERAEKHAAQLEDAISRATRAAKAAMRAQAEAVAGNTLDIPEVPPFDGSAIIEEELDVDQVRELCAEVRKSFKTFKEVVRDNGLFAAFASEGTFGACRGWRFGFWLDDFLYDLSEYEGEVPGRSEMHDIPSDVEEDEGGDSVERSVERMREFNKQRYWGMLDDDFDAHVEAFWYGFKKLMEGVNGLYRLNPAAFNQYCNDLADGVKQAALDMGASSMDAHQVEEFCKEVERKKGV